MNYRADHIKILKFLGKDLPKRTVFTVAEISKVFADIEKRRPDTNLDPDRATRNALRKPRKEDHVQISERGEYQLTPQGAAFVKKIAEYVVAPSPCRDKDDSSEERPPRSKAGKVEEKKGGKVKMSAMLKRNKAKVEKDKEEKKKSGKGKVKVSAKAAVKSVGKKRGIRIPKTKKPEGEESIVAADESVVMDTTLDEDEVENALHEREDDEDPVGSQLSI